ncbi:MAG TPA: PKD domain-containing protein [Micromonosporaceae bacterium]|nr:PKD domain-containing protein [Micromonosporaceae bacterium]
MVFLSAFAGVVVVPAAAASATPPGNDDFANATSISSLPFADSGSLAEATAEPGEPQQWCASQQTVWYALTPASGITITADAIGSDFGVGLSIYRSTGSSFYDLQFLDCIGYGRSSSLRAEAGATYYLRVGSFSVEPRSFQLHVQVLPPPPNDDFAAATPATTIPFTSTVDHLIAATMESPDEPIGCAGGTLEGSVWWAFTPAAAGHYVASLDGPLSPNLAVYTGSALASLDLAACSSGSSVAFLAGAGTTYYVRAAGWFRIDFPMYFRLDTAPAPVAAFFSYPPDPSVFDTVYFSDTSHDPARGEIVSQVWTFGDGAIAEGCCPTHQYAQDGTYTVGLTVTTRDGRTASTEQPVQVLTHDVAIARIGVPDTARVGQLVTVNVEVRNSRYPETVQVDLYRIGPEGFEPVGSLTQLVAVQRDNKTTRFSFTYLVTEADRSVGGVRFNAVATVFDHRDAAPADNETVSPPVEVR